MPKIPKSVLVIDDEQAIIMAISKALKKAGYTVFEAENGQDGLNIALANHPDLILLDIIMPVMDGSAMLAKLRADSWGKTAKVILLTNLSDSKLTAAAMTKGAIGYIIKSNTKLEEIVRMVKGELDK